MFTCRHFAIQELVPPEIYAGRGDKAWELLNPKILHAADGIRDMFGPTIVNTWHSRDLVTHWGRFTESGYRTPETKTGAKLSQHRLGCALDLKFTETTPIAVYEHIMANPDDFPEITCMENAHSTKSWLHIDCRNCDPIKVVNV